MNSWTKLNKNESGQAALEAAIILIAFVVVASVFAFAVLSAGTASTAKGEQAIYSGLEQVQSSMAIKGALLVEANAGKTSIDSVVFDLSLVSGSDPVNLDDVAASKVMVISYRDPLQSEPNLDWTADFLVYSESAAADDLLEEGELVEITADLTGLVTPLGINTPFSLEIKPPTGAVIQINRTTPAAFEAFQELR